MFKDRVAVVTGGTSGMGLATATLFAERGGTAIVTGRDATRTSQVSRQTESGGEVIGISGDIAKIDDLIALRCQVEERAGGIDFLFANAGVGVFSRFEDCTVEEFDESTNINWKGTFFSIQRLLPLMRDGGSIVVNASWTHHRGLANTALYAPIKAALVSLTRTLAVELEPRRIRVNAVSPGYINTGQFNEWSLAEETAREMKSQVLGRAFGSPEQVAEVVLFLFSDASSYVNGQEWLVDSGLTAAHRTL